MKKRFGAQIVFFLLLIGVLTGVRLTGRGHAPHGSGVVVEFGEGELFYGGLTWLVVSACSPYP